MLSDNLSHYDQVTAEISLLFLSFWPDQKVRSLSLLPLARRLTLWPGQKKNIWGTSASRFYKKTAANLANIRYFLLNRCLLLYDRISIAKTAINSILFFSYRATFYHYDRVTAKNYHSAPVKNPNPLHHPSRRAVYPKWTKFWPSPNKKFFHSLHRIKSSCIPDPVTLQKKSVILLPPRKQNSYPPQQNPAPNRQTPNSV